MANETTTTTLATLLPEIVAEAMFIAEEESLMRQLVRNYTVALGTGKTVNVPKYPVMTAAAVAESADLSNTAVTSGEAVLTIGEVGLMTTVKDFAVRSAPQAVITDIGQLFGGAIARKIDADLVALFSGFSNALGTGAADFTAAAVFQAVAKLRKLSVPMTGMICVIDPEVAYDLKADISNTFVNPNSGDVQNEAMTQGYIGRLAGIPVYESAHATGGAVFHRDALALAVQSDIGLELQRDASARATEIVGVATYGVGELEDTYGMHLNYVSTIA